MVYVGKNKYRYGRMFLSHMASDNLKELHEMATELGVRKYFQDKEGKPHYDISQVKKQQAIKLGARLVPDKKIVEVLKENFSNKNTQMHQIEDFQFTLNKLEHPSSEQLNIPKDMLGEIADAYARKVQEKKDTHAQNAIMLHLGLTDRSKINKEMLDQLDIKLLHHSGTLGESYQWVQRGDVPISTMLTIRWENQNILMHESIVPNQFIYKGQESYGWSKVELEELDVEYHSTSDTVTFHFKPKYDDPSETTITYDEFRILKNNLPFVENPR